MINNCCYKKKLEYKHTFAECSRSESGVELVLSTGKCHNIELEMEHQGEEHANKVDCIYEEEDILIFCEFKGDPSFFSKVTGKGFYINDFNELKILNSKFYNKYTQTKSFVDKTYCLCGCEGNKYIVVSPNIKTAQHKETLNKLSKEFKDLGIENEFLISSEFEKRFEKKINYDILNMY